MDLPYTWSDDANGMQKCSWNPHHAHSKYYTSNTLMLKTPNPYEDGEVNGDSCDNCDHSWAEPPVEIHEECTTDIDLPPLVWHGYDVTPKMLSACNTGRTISVKGQWTNGKPYVEGGPLNGKYIFSQIHFHCPSEHSIDGRRYPLEMHVVHYKNSYLTQERAMHEKDGTLVLVYLFQVTEIEQTALSEITQVGSCLASVNDRVEISKIPLGCLVKPFVCNYYVYWGSVTMKKNSYILQWIINCNQLEVTKYEVDALLNMMNSGTLMVSRGAKMKPLSSIIYRVGENYEMHQPSPVVNTETNIPMHIDESEPCENKQLPVCPHETAHEPCENKQLLGCPHETAHEPCENKQLLGCPHETAHEPCENKQLLGCPHETAHEPCAKHSVSSPVECLTHVPCFTQPPCPTHSNENPCTHHSAEVTIQPQENSNAQSQNVCGNCGGLEVEIAVPKHVCICKDKAPKVCSSCGGSKSGISWCKRKWKQCASKCSVWSRTSSCSNTQDMSCKKCSKKRKPKKKYPKRESSDTSCSDHHACPKKKSRESAKKKPLETPCSPKGSKVCVEIKPCGDPCKKPSEEACKKPSSSDASHTSCSSKSEPEVCPSKKKQKAKKPHQVTKTKSKVSVEKVETLMVEKTSDEENCKQSPTKKHSKTSVKKKESSKGKKGKKQLKKKEDTCESSESLSEGKKMKTAKKKKAAEDCDEITTLFVKMPENILSPCTKSSQSYSDETVSVEKRENDSEEDPKCPIKVTEPEFIVNTFTTSGLKMPDSGGSSTSKELYLQMKHSFRSEKSESVSRSQEFQVSIVCGSNILQEYKGLFTPQKISLGSFEKLQLVPKFKDPEDLRVRLQECVVKKPSADKFCIDSKFLLKGLNARDIFPKFREEQLNHLKEKPYDIFDAETQYSEEEIETGAATPVELLSQSVQTDDTYVSKADKIKRVFCKRLDLKSQKVQTEPEDKDQKKKNLKDLIKHKRKILKTTSEPEFLSSSKKHRQSQVMNLMEAKICKSVNADKLSDKLECKIKLIKNPQSSAENSEVDSSSKLFQKMDVDKNELDISQRNTVYFMYDRIEKDPLTGKKIFMGRFRTRDDLKILKEHKITSKIDSLKSFGSRTTTEDCSSDSSKVIDFEKFIDLPHSRDASSEMRKLSQESKNEVSGHKFEPKCLELTQFKAQNSRLVSEVVKWFQEDGENFDLLADIIGFHKKEKLKNIRRAEMRESDCESGRSMGSPDLENPTYEDKTTMYSDHSLSSQNAENSVALKSLDSNAVIIVPVEVESWSKIEVVLIERSDDQEEVKQSKKYVPLL